MEQNPIPIFETGAFNHSATSPTSLRAMVGARGFEPPTSRPPDGRANRTTLRPDKTSKGRIGTLSTYLILPELTTATRQICLPSGRFTSRIV